MIDAINPTQKAILHKLANQVAPKAWEEARRRLEIRRDTERFKDYRDRPVAFIQEVLKDRLTQDAIAIAESVVENTITVVRSGNDLGKSFVAARLCVWFFKAYMSNDRMSDVQVYMTAAPPVENIRRILWGEVMSAARQRPDLFMGDTILSMRITSQKPRSFIEAVTIPTAGSEEERESRFSGKHAPHMLFVVDEGDAVPDEIYRGIEGCMSSKHVRLLIMFNPRIQSGAVYRMEMRKTAHIVHMSAFDHPNVITGKDVIPGAVSQDTTVRRISDWTRPLAGGEVPGEDTFEVPKFLVGAQAVGLNGLLTAPLAPGLRKIVDPAFAYMVLGKYPVASEWQLISSDWIDSARIRWDAYVARHGERPPEGINPIIGLDVAEGGGDSNAAIPRYDHFVLRPKVWQGMDVDMTARQALQYYRELSADAIMVDALAVGASVAPSIVRLARDTGERVRAVAVKVSERPTEYIKAEQGEFYTLRDQLWWACREWLRTNKNAMLPPDQLLTEELRAPTYRVPDDGKIHVMNKEQLRNILRRSPDRADALCLTFMPAVRAKVLRLSGKDYGHGHR